MMMMKGEKRNVHTRRKNCFDECGRRSLTQSRTQTRGPPSLPYHDDLSSSSSTKKHHPGATSSLSWRNYVLLLFSFLYNFLNWRRHQRGMLLKTQRTHTQKCLFIFIFFFLFWLRFFSYFLEQRIATIWWRWEKVGTEMDLNCLVNAARHQNGKILNAQIVGNNRIESKANRICESLEFAERTTRKKERKKEKRTYLFFVVTVIIIVIIITYMCRRIYINPPRTLLHVKWSEVSSSVSWVAGAAAHSRRTPPPFSFSSFSFLSLRMRSASLFFSSSNFSVCLLITGFIRQVSSNRVERARPLRPHQSSFSLFFFLLVSLVSSHYSITRPPLSYSHPLNYIFV